MNFSPSLLSAHSLAFVEQARQRLSQRFEADFSVWLVDEQGLQQLSDDAAAWAAAHRPLLEALCQDRLLPAGVHCSTYESGAELIVHVTTVCPGTAVLIAGIASVDRQRLMAQLATSAVQEVEQEIELQDSRGCLVEYADQVTNDFEELAWLRNLAEQIQACDLKSDLCAVSEAILPPLRELINAEGIALIREPSGDPQDPYECAYSLGTLDIDMQTCTRLIQSCNAKSGQPIVRNSTQLTDDSPDTFGLRNFILVHITRAGSTFGWLLVANRAILGNSPDELRVNASCLSGWEFGTFEAGIVNAAAVMLGTHARNSQLFREREDLLLGVVRALINAVDAKDAYTCGHSDRVASIAQRIARKMQLSAIECERIYMAGLLHDIGKIGIPDSVLCKAGKLTDDEFAVIQQHPAIGHSILRHVKQLEYVLPGVLHHHESYDGSGYPHALAGEAIPIYGRVLAVADAYDAMTSTRSYRRAMDPEKAKSILRKGAGSQWDPRAVAAFFDAVAEIDVICDENHPSKVIPASRECLGQRALDPCSGLAAALTALEDAYE